MTNPRRCAPTTVRLTPDQVSSLHRNHCPVLPECAHVGNEVEAGNIRPGIWTKATSLASSSNEEDIKREYIRLRVELLRAEGRLFQQFIKDVSEAADEPPPDKTPGVGGDELIGFLAEWGWVGVILLVALVVFVFGGH
jgi:hypothetical protein